MRYFCASGYVFFLSFAIVSQQNLVVGAEMLGYNCFCKLFISTVESPSHSDIHSGGIIVYCFYKQPYLLGFLIHLPEPKRRLKKTSYCVK